MFQLSFSFGVQIYMAAKEEDAQGPCKNLGWAFVQFSLAMLLYIAFAGSAFYSDCWCMVLAWVLPTASGCCLVLVLLVLVAAVSRLGPVICFGSGLGKVLCLDLVGQPCS
ncbi:hypothetical protein U1Q18_037864 [Sarracenia purpurea var. burkii]